VDDYSYGYRANRDCHKALNTLKNELWNGTNWVVDADIKGFFDNVDHEWLMRFLEHDIEDKNFLRYVKRFLKAGIMEEGKYININSYCALGGLISPVLANVYLHYTIDVWFAKAIIPKCEGKAAMVRYADDIVFCFESEKEARSFYVVLQERLAKFKLELSEEKSKIIRFGISAGSEAGKFDFMGFTHLIAKSREGKPCVKRITSQKKLKAKRQNAKKWMRENMHTPIKILVEKLNKKLQGHYNYYGIIGNYDAMDGFRRYVLNRMKAVLDRRGAKNMTYEKFERILKYNPVVRPRIVHRV